MKFNYSAIALPITEFHTASPANSRSHAFGIRNFTSIVYLDTLPFLA